MDKDVFYIKQAIELAKKGCGRVNPNPMVGAVIVKSGTVIGQGYHEKYGELHAERNAIKDCKEDPNGSTLYVTLEPCCHYGKTPPCTDAIIENQIKRVVIGCVDPNESVAGKGIKILKEHGIEVEINVCEKECRELNEVFLHYIKKKTPYVVMKYGMTLDGKIATTTGESKWITGEVAREHVHIIRNQLSGIMVGIRTVLIDNPLLTCRIPNGRNPIRIICDSHLQLPLDSNIAKTAKDIPTIVATISKDSYKKNMLEAMNIQVLIIKEKEGKVDLEELVIRLGAMKIDSILLEGGATLNYNALTSGIVNKILAFVAPKIFGGTNSPSPVEGIGVSNIEDGFSLTRKKITELGEDILLEYDVGVKKCSRV